MPDEDVHLPLSGNVTQTFFPLTVNLGRSGSEATEKEALSLASYGRQLGRIGDVLAILLDHLELKGLTAEEQESIADLRCMLRQIAKIKQKRVPKPASKPASASAGS